MLAIGRLDSVYLIILQSQKFFNYLITLSINNLSAAISTVLKLISIIRISL